MGRLGIQKITRYSDDFKITAVRLSDLPEVLIQDVAAALDIHPFMLSRWRKQVREGASWPRARSLIRRRELKKKYAILKEEHELLTKPSGLLPHESGSLRLHRSKPGMTRNCHDVPGVDLVTALVLQLLDELFVVTIFPRRPTDF